MMRSVVAGFVQFLLCCSLALPSLALGAGSGQEWIQPYPQAPLQNIVTWDKHSLFVRGQRIMFFSGEFHPFRLPVPSLWLDVFQKIRSMGYTGVSFYVDWALLEGKAGEFSAKGAFAFEPFFEAATKAGIYLLARPGPYINAEVSGGGFPGWFQRIKAHPRTADPDYLAATELYVREIGKIIAKAQITNGGPVILLQPENEYTGAAPGVPFPDPVYFQHVMDQFRAAGIVVPMISNDANNGGHNAPGQPAAVDIYGHDGYPLRFDCANPTVWPSGVLPKGWFAKHLQQSPSTPFSLIEFQGGSFDPWGGPGMEKCARLLNDEFQRVFYKNDYSFGVTIFNIYMAFGGTNWGNLGHPGGYTSYDYGAMVAEDRTISRASYSESKLQSNFLVASPSFLTAVPELGGNTTHSDSPDITTSLLKSNTTQYLVIRHSDYSTTKTTSYTISLPGTSAGDVSIPQAGESLSLHGRDSKIMVFDYNMNGITLLYSTAEIFTWQDYDGQTVCKLGILVVYGGPDEQHEMAVALSNGNELPTPIVGSGIAAAVRAGYTILSWKTTPADRALKLGPLVIYFLDRESAYRHWVLDVPRSAAALPIPQPPFAFGPGLRPRPFGPPQLGPQLGQQQAPLAAANAPFTNTGDLAVIIKGGYLIRTATISGSTMALHGDINATSTFKIIGGAPRALTSLTFNDKAVQFTQDQYGIVTFAVAYTRPEIVLPDLNLLKWYYIDSLPEIQANYSDASWTKADYPKTDNTFRNLSTPTSLYASEYGYHTGALIYRGRFTAKGNESSLYLQTSGGSAFAMSAWLDDKFLGSFVGSDQGYTANTTFKLGNLLADKEHNITVVVDNMGLDENWTVGYDEVKRPRGILDYKLDGRVKESIKWKLTGNFGGENYPDKARGPLNEGGLWGERQGYHLPAPPIANWKSSKGPTEGISAPGIAWYVTRFQLDMPTGYDIPLSFVFANTSETLTTSEDTKASAYRVNIYVNGWQFGKYVNNVGPQTKFPVPEGIFNYKGTNWVAMSLWALEAGGAKVADVQLVAGPVIQSGFGKVQNVPSPAWSQRAWVY